jgi:hypothetical protein
MTLIQLPVICDQCKKANLLWVSQVPEYTGKTLRMFWCQNPECGKNQCIRYQFDDKGIPEVTEHIDPATVSIEKPAEVSITIRPRGKTR